MFAAELALTSACKDDDDDNGGGAGFYGSSGRSLGVNASPLISLERIAHVHLLAALALATRNTALIDSVDADDGELDGSRAAR